MHLLQIQAFYTEESLETTISLHLSAIEVVQLTGKSMTEIPKSSAAC